MTGLTQVIFSFRLRLDFCGKKSGIQVLIHKLNQKEVSMSLVKWNPESSLFPSISNWMDDFFPDNGFKNWKGVSVPAVNVTETKTAFKLKMAAPGFKKEDFKLEVQNGLLMISGEKKVETEEKDETYTRQEYSYASFSRSFSLPENVKGDGIAAEYADGVLKITMPKRTTDEKPTMQISVK